MTVHDPKKVRIVRVERPVVQEVPQVLPQQMPPIVYAPTPKGGSWAVPVAVGIVSLLVVLVIGTGYIDISSEDNAVASETAPAKLTPTTKPAATPRPAVGSLVPARIADPIPTLAPAATVVVHMQLDTVPVERHTDINPDGSYTIDGGQIRYYPDTAGNITEARLPGSDVVPQTEGLPPEQKIFVYPTTEADKAWINAQPTAAPRQGSPCRRGCPKP